MASSLMSFPSLRSLESLGSLGFVPEEAAEEVADKTISWAMGSSSSIQNFSFKSASRLDCSSVCQSREMSIIVILN